MGQSPRGMRRDVGKRTIASACGYGGASSAGDRVDGATDCRKSVRARIWGTTRLTLALLLPGGSESSSGERRDKDGLGEHGDDNIKPV